MQVRSRDRDRTSALKYPIPQIIQPAQIYMLYVSSQIVGLSTSDRRKMKKDASTFHALSLSEGSRRSIGLSGFQEGKEETGVVDLFCTI